MMSVTDACARVMMTGVDPAPAARSPTDRMQVAMAPLRVGVNVSRLLLTRTKGLLRTHPSSDAAPPAVASTCAIPDRVASSRMPPRRAASGCGRAMR
jgi:hypothetical protein